MNDPTAAASPRGWPSRLLDFGKSVFEAIDPALSPRFLLGSVGGLLLGVIALVIYLRSGDALKPVSVRMNGPLTLVTAPTGPSVRIVVAPVWASHESYEPYDVLAAYLGKQLQRTVVVAHRRTQGEVSDLLARASVQAAVVSEAAYLELKARNAAVQALVVPVTHGQPLHQSITIVKADSKYTGLAELRGHSFAFTDPASLTGYYAPLAEVLTLPDAGTDFFARTFFSYGDEASMRAVRDGSVDAAAVAYDVFEQEVDKAPAWRSSLRVIHSSESYGTGPLVVPTTLAPPLRASLLAVLLRLHEQPEGRAVLAGLHMERFIEPPADLYDSAARTVAQVKATRQVRP